MTWSWKKAVGVVAVSFALGGLLTCCAGYYYLEQLYRWRLRSRFESEAVSRGERLGRPAPLFSAETIDGRLVSLESMRGKVVLLDFWATWCSPCIRELPHLKDVWREFGDREDFELLGISLDEDVVDLRSALIEHEIPWSQVLQTDRWDGPIPQRYHVSGIPRILAIDRQGRLRFFGLRGERIKKALDLLFLEANANRTNEEECRLERLRVWEKYHTDPGRDLEQWREDLLEVCDRHPETIECAKTRASCAAAMAWSDEAKAFDQYKAILEMERNLPPHIAYPAYGYVLSKLLDQGKQTEAIDVWRGANNKYPNARWITLLKRDVPRLMEFAAPTNAPTARNDTDVGNSKQPPASPSQTAQGGRE